MLLGLLYFFCLPLSLWACLIFMEGGFQLDSSRYQTKWDAVILSLCHQTRAYLNKNLVGWNRKIQIQQEMMSAQVASCIAQATALASKGGPPAFSARMKICNRQLKLPSDLGQKMQELQETELSLFVLRLIPKESQLRRENELEVRAKAVWKSINSHELKSAFQRADLKAQHFLAENLIASYGPRRQWPRVWIARAPDLPKASRISVSYQIKAQTFGDVFELNEIDSRAFHSSCWIKEIESGFKYEAETK